MRDSNRFSPTVEAILVMVMLLLMGLMVGTIVYEEQNPFTCVEEKRIVKILSVQYRHATVQFEDGTTQEINQGSFKPGDMRCVRSIRMKNEH